MFVKECAIVTFYNNSVITCENERNGSVVNVLVCKQSVSGQNGRANNTREPAGDGL